MADPHAAARDLLEERPELESKLEAVLDVDEAGTWTFDDVDLDSGTFGELVSRGVVEKVDGEYRVADREAVRAALDGDAYDTSTDEEGSALGERLETRVADVNRDLVVGLAGALAFLFVMRTLTVRRVFRGEQVFLPGNDPYHYLYWVERLSESETGAFDLAGVAEVLGGRANGEPFTYVLGWWANLLVGGSTDTAATVVAWIPVVCALVVGGLVYVIAVWTTEDERIGIASVVVFALLPGHALYSGIGFFDHHTIDYVWLAASIAGVLWLARNLESRDDSLAHLRSPLTWGVVGVLGVVFAAMIHTWNGSPILLVGVAVYLTVRATSDIRTDRSPVIAGVPIIAALGVGFLLGYLVHTRFGWQESVVVYSPLLVAAGGSLVVAGAAVVQRLDAHPGFHLGIAAASVLPLWIGFRRVRPDEASRLYDRAVGDLLGREGIAETRALFAADYGVFFGPVDHFGWFLFVALPVLGWVSWKCIESHEPRWLVVGSYSYTLLAFALLQIRFAGEATAVVAVLAGTGVVVLLSKIDLAGAPTPFVASRSRHRFTLWPSSMSVGKAGYVVLTVAVVASLSLFMVPAIMDTVAIDDEEAEAALWVDEAADDSAYVLSNWGRSRMYNYVVSGDSDGYGYALNHYEPFITDSDPDARYEEFRDRVDYVVIDEIEETADPSTAYAQLFEHHGSNSETAEGSGQFQLVHTTAEDGVKVFRPVEGAVITGEADDEVQASTEVTVRGETFEYERSTAATESGEFEVRVAYPGTYTIDGETVTVSEEDVENGSEVAV